MRPRIQMHCRESGEPLSRGTDTFYGVRKPYNYFHYCRCHKMLCVAKCSHCGLIAYSNCSKHAKKYKGHSLVVENSDLNFTYNPTIRRKRKASEDYSSDIQIEIESQSVVANSADASCEELFWALVNQWIPFDLYDSVAPLIKETNTSCKLEVQDMLTLLSFCIERNDATRWRQEGIPKALLLAKAANSRC